MTSDNTPPMYDVVISGGGVVGCLAAFALAKHCNLRVCLLEASDCTEKHAGFDARVIALAANSLKVLHELGIDLSDIAHQPIEQIHVSDRGHLGQVRLSAKDYGLDALGKVVAIDALGDYLLKAIKSLELVTIMRPAKITQIEREQEYTALVISGERTLHCRLLLISDGGKSSTADLVNVKKLNTDYQQVGIISNIEIQTPHNNTAYERFTKSGPLALLPMNAACDGESSDDDKRLMSIVWCLSKQSADSLMAMPDQQFLQELQSAFSWKLGKFMRCSQRFTYPLRLSRADIFSQHRVICIGNAAQTLHPIAGQGFNLGLRDVATLLRVLRDERAKNSAEAFDCGSFSVSQTYKQSRTADKQATIFATDGLLRVFSNEYLPMEMARNIGLLALNKLPPFKQAFANFAMGKRD